MTQPSEADGRTAQRMLVVAPVGRDAALLIGALAGADIDAEACAGPEPLALRLADLAPQGPGGVVIAEEALTPSRTEAFRSYLSHQPPWSDLPILVVTLPGSMTPKRLKVIDALGPAGSVSLLERPFQASTLVSLVHVALRTRRRQYEVREHLDRQARSAQHITKKAADLARSNAELEQFAAIASHDLSEPLRMITSYLALVQRRYAPLFDEKATEYFTYVTHAAHRMRAMIDSILNYSRVGTDGIACAWFESATAVGDAIDALDVTLKAVKAEVMTDHLPAVYANQLLISQVIQNLLSNAVKFCGQVPQIHISVTEDPTGWTFLVRDNGIGIPEDGKEKLFNIFQRFHSPEHFPGTGIGLATCRKIADIHHGRIWVAQTGPEGTTMAFFIPRPNDA